MRTRIEVPGRRLAGEFPAGTSLHEAVRVLGHVIDWACGGQAVCGTCAVRVVEGASCLTPADPEEEARIAEAGLAPPWRLSCRAHLTGAPGRVVLSHQEP